MSEAEAELAPYPAERAAAWLVVNAPAVAVNVAIVELAGTVTEAGAVSAAELSVIETAAPPAGAGLDNLTVQTVLVEGSMTEGAHCSDVTLTGATRDRTAACDDPLNDAVSVAFWLAEIVLVLAVKVAVAAPAATVTVLGTANDGVELVTARTVDTDAALESVIVQGVLAFGAKEAPAHFRDETSGGAATRLTVAL